MLSLTHFFVILLPLFPKVFQSKIFFVLSNFYSLCNFQNTTVSFPFKIRHVVLNPSPHLLRVSSKYLLRTLFFYLERILSASPLLSVLHIRCPPLLPVPLKILFFHLKWLRRDLERSPPKFLQPGLSPSREFFSYPALRRLQSSSHLKSVSGATPSYFMAETW